MSYIVVIPKSIGFLVDRVLTSKENQDNYMRIFAPKGAIAGVTDKRVLRGQYIQGSEFVADTAYVYAKPQKTIKNFMCK